MRTASIAAIMTPNPDHVDLDDPPSRALQFMATGRYHHLPVLDGTRVVGMVSDADLARVALRTFVRDGLTDGVWLDSLYRMRDLMTPVPICVRIDQSVGEAAKLLAAGTFHALPVLDASEALVGILTTTDLAKLLSADVDERVDASVLSELRDELRVQAWLGSKELLTPSDRGGELRDEVRTLARLRDTLRMQFHLGRMEANEQWAELESSWHRLIHGGLKSSATVALRDANEEVRESLGRIRAGYATLRSRIAGGGR